jgi:allophanate hydrolase
LSDLRDYAQGASVAGRLAPVLDALDADDPVWLALAPREQVLARARALDALPPEARAALPLFGVPFAVKDNIDVAGLPTTAACPAFAYEPARSATAVERLEAAGALAVGKTNLDQFATGLVGTRTPYGVPRNPFHADYVPGGSSSGSAVAVARRLVPFALGTDTAGSGRVPAGFNGLVGLKPTCGTVSTAGVVPACRSLDCVSIFATTVADASLVYDALAGFDPGDAFSRQRRVAPPPDPAALRYAVPLAAQREFFGDDEARDAFEATLDALQAMTAPALHADLGPCFEAAALLYEGAFVAERTAAVGDFAARHPGALLAVTRTIVEAGRSFSAVDAFRATYRIAELRAAVRDLFSAIDVLVVPTTPTIYRLSEVEAEPFLLNSRLGTYTNFVNLLDLCALAIPTGRYRNGIPLGITLIGPAFGDAALAAFAQRLTPPTLLPP